MAVDLSTYAKNHSLSEFQKEWCKQLTPPKTYADMTASDHANSSAAYNAYKSPLNSSTASSAPRDFNIQSVLTAGANTKSTLSETTEKYLTPLQLMDKKTLGEEILKQIERESQLHTDINEKMGISGELSRSYRDSIIETVPHAVRLGFDIKNLTDLTTKLAEGSGKFNLISQDTMEKTVVTTRAFGTTMSEMASTMVEFEKIGLGQSDTLAKINDAGKTSMALGLNSKNVLKDLQANLANINQYGFKNGVEGLTRMAQKATEFRMAMTETFKLAEKVMNPESAIELTANMQMLGGAVGDLNDPLKLMYMATNNVEGLQDALHGAAAGLATYNKEQGRFELVGANLRRAQEMAKQLGVDYKEFAKGAIAANERILAGEQLAAKGFDIDDKDKEFLTNMSQMKGGEMTITIPQSLMETFGKDFNNKTEVKLSELNSNQVAALKANREKLEEMNPEDIAKGQFTSLKNSENYLKSIAAEVVQGTKNRLLGRNEYVGGKEPIERGAVNMETIGRGMSNVTDVASKKVLLGIQNGITDTIKIITKEIEKVFTAGAKFMTGGETDPKILQEKIENYYKKLYIQDKRGENEIENENQRLKKWYQEGNGKNQIVTFNNNLKVTHLGLGNNITVDQTEKGYLTPTTNNYV
jgi:hypothetical protein